MKNIHYRRTLYVILFLISFENSYAEPEAVVVKNQKIADTGKLVNRRVLIFDFVNTNDSAEYGYLETSIPDALPDPLNKTKSFELMSRSIWQEILKDKKVQKKDAYDEKIAIQTGKTHMADVVVMGSFAVSKDAIIISTHAIEVSSGRTMVSNTKVSKLDGTIFTAITALAKDMSAEMKEKLPPLPQQLITEERVKYVEKGNDNDKKMAEMNRKLGEKDEEIKKLREGKSDGSMPVKSNWADKKFAIGIFTVPGITLYNNLSMNKIDFNDYILTAAYKENYSYTFGAALNFRYFFLEKFHLSYEFEWASGGFTSKPSFWGSGVSFGYDIYQNSFHWFVEVGPYLSVMGRVLDVFGKTWAYDSKTDIWGFFGDPYYGWTIGPKIGAGVEWLLFKNFSLGVKTDIGYNVDLTPSRYFARFHTGLSVMGSVIF